MCVENNNGEKELTLYNVTLLTNVDWFDILNKNKDREMHLCTFDNPNEKKVKDAVKLIKDGKVIIGTNFLERPWDVVENCTNVKVKHNSHAKMLLIAPDEVYLSSQNIVYSDWYQTTVHIKDKRAYDYYLDLFILEWFKPEELNGTCDSDTDVVTPEDYKKIFSEELPKSFSGKISTVPKTVFLDKCLCNMVILKDWMTKIAGIKDSSVIITTFTLPNQKYVCECLDRLLENNNRVTLVVNQREPKDAVLVSKIKEIYQRCANIKIRGCENIHSKMLLHSGNNVWLSSQNFGDSGVGYFESAIQIKDSRAYQFYYEQLYEFLGSEFELD